MAKASKAKAHYRKGAPHRRCDLCTMFQPPHGCTAVTGSIAPDKLCDYFERRRRDWYGKKD